LFLAMFYSFQTNNSVRIFSAINSVNLENAGGKASGKPYHIITNRHLVLSGKRTGTQRKTKVRRFVYDTSIVHTAIGKKAHLGMKQVKKSSQCTCACQKYCTQCTLLLKCYCFYCLGSLYEVRQDILIEQSLASGILLYSNKTVISLA